MTKSFGMVISVKMKEKREIKNKDEIKLIFITKYDVFRKVFYAKTNGYGFSYP